MKKVFLFGKSAERVKLYLLFKLFDNSPGYLRLESALLLWCFSKTAFENAAEMGNVVESAFVTYLLDGQCCVAEQMAGH